VTRMIGSGPDGVFCSGPVATKACALAPAAESASDISTTANPFVESPVCLALVERARGRRRKPGPFDG
jgi:hypothetical protein